ncbi:MAG: 4'-phosphopantetheinyl transferase superfamily protein [Treponema sp.]|jgi:4'-phosphopantetheinyl transferase|nr:4'-phosphopantetheinyl transferase superfamily protein [Treponema sp.]
MSYYLNLSILSNNLNNLPKTERVKRLSAEARRILSPEGDIARDAAGRPFFPNRDADFSISHSGALAAVSLVEGKNLRTGCDVELVRPRSKARAIAQDFFTAPERDYIESGGSFDETRFYRIWTLKECFLKLRGLSVFDMAGAPSFISGDGQFAFSASGASPILFNIYELAGAGERYILATALEGTEMEQPEIRWFSQDSLVVCKSIKFTTGI